MLSANWLVSRVSQSSVYLGSLNETLVFETTRLDYTPVPLLPVTKRKMMQAKRVCQCNIEVLLLSMYIPTGKF